MAHAAQRSAKALAGLERLRNDENATPAHDASAYISASMLQSGGLSPLPTSAQLYDIHLPDISALSPLPSHPTGSRAPTRQALHPLAASNQRRDAASSLHAASAAKHNTRGTQVSVVVPHDPGRVSRSRSRSISARPSPSASAPNAAIEAEGGLMTPPASGMSALSSSQLDQSEHRPPHPTSPTPLKPRSRTQSPHKRMVQPPSSHSLTPGTLTSTPARPRRAASPHNKRTRDLVETPVMARMRDHSTSLQAESIFKNSPNPRARKNTRTSQLVPGVASGSINAQSDSELDSDEPLANASRLDPVQASALIAGATRLPPSSGRAANAKSKGKGKGRIVSGAAYRDDPSTALEEDDEDGDSDVEIVRVTRRNGPEASFLREAREKGWDRIANSPVRTIYIQQPEPPQRQRQGSARAKSKTPKPESQESLSTPAGRARSRSSSRPLANVAPPAAADNSAADLSSQSIKSSSSQSSTSTISRKKQPGPARRRASSSASTSNLRIKTKTGRSRRISAPPSNVGEYISEHPAMPDSPSEDPLLLVGPEPDFSARYNASVSYGRSGFASPSVTASGIRASQKHGQLHDSTFAIPEGLEEGGDSGEDDDEDDGYNDYEPLVFEDASRISQTNASRPKTTSSAQMLTSTPLPGARMASKLPAEIPLPSSVAATPSAGNQIEIDGVTDTPQQSSHPATTSFDAGDPRLDDAPETSFDVSLEREADGSSAETSHELPTSAHDPGHEDVIFGQFHDDGPLSSDESSAGGYLDVDRAAADESLAAAPEVADDVAIEQGDDSDASGSLSGAEGARAGEGEGDASTPRTMADYSRDETNNAVYGAGERDRDSDMEFVGQAYNRDQDARIQSGGNEEEEREDGGSDNDDDDNNNNDDDGREQDSRSAGALGQDSDESGRSGTTGNQSSEADSSRIDEDVDSSDEMAARLDSADAEEVEILAGSSTRDRTPELPIDDHESQSSSDGFEILDIVTADGSSILHGKQRAVSQGKDEDRSLPIHTLQLIHQDDVRAAADASRSMRARSFGANASMSVDASSASAYSRFLRLSQQTTTPIVEISSLDPHAAARATAILKLYHQYVDEGWIQGDEEGEALRGEALGEPSSRHGAHLPDDMDPQERLKVQQVVRILQEAERIAAGQKSGRADRSDVSASYVDAGSLTLPQILMDAEINIARQDAHTEASSDDGFSVRGLLAPEDEATQLRTPMSGAKAAATIASPATPFLPGGFRPEPASVVRETVQVPTASDRSMVAQVEPTVWGRSDWVSLDKFFAARVKASARAILRADLSRSGIEDVSHTQIVDVDKVALQIQALLSVDAHELAGDFLDQRGVAENDRRAEWASSKIRFRIPALQRKYLRKLESKHPGRVTAEHVSLLDQSARGDLSSNAPLLALGLGRAGNGGNGNGNDSIATEDLDWSLTGMTTRIQASRDGHGDMRGQANSSATGLRPKEGRRAGRVSFGTPYRLGMHSTPMPALKRVQEQAKRDGLYPSLQQLSARTSKAQEAGVGVASSNEPAAAAPTDATALPRQVQTPAKTDQGSDGTTSTPSVVARTTRLLSRMSGSFFGLGASPGSTSASTSDASAGKAAAASAMKSMAASAATTGDASRGSTSSSASRIPALKKAKARRHTPIRQFGGRASSPVEMSGGGKEMQMAAQSAAPVSIDQPPSPPSPPPPPPSEQPQQQRQKVDGVSAKPRTSSPPTQRATTLNRKPSISAADLQAASRSIREKRTSTSFLAPRYDDSTSASTASGRSTQNVGRVIDTRPTPATTTTTNTKTATTTASAVDSGKGSITIRRSNSGSSGLVRPTALSLLPNAEASHQMAREKVKQLAKSRQDRDWKSPRASRVTRTRSHAENRVVTAIATEIRKRAGGGGGGSGGSGSSTR
ncbi:uncharacterized protein PFL1_02876 [Pseudozyma flocculosa PF-1]|uniref:Uncharacterized protein n=2 Tax=Pseudozyma flocculosa TaxID=84751 RepID=A0A5C3F130_9BASI|nr:uncharacterized protein PFL1_02876 [Pseudozyma flocculosa PF-1]EPQ29656.1 hypothetical protein PFL1_02876 [Pseudozyma flocculosa PF-1]SPO38224.1 uncharacterized protein PSFLO_03701 [Pseudozyma flocculosa]